jgi:hypothetical protein
LTIKSKFHIISIIIFSELKHYETERYMAGFLFFLFWHKRSAHGLYFCFFDLKAVGKKNHGLFFEVWEYEFVLIGYRCSGKTSIGRLIAHKLGRRFVDTDDLIIKDQAAASVKW